MPNFPLRFHPRFVVELEGAIEYYHKKSKTAGGKFRSAVKKQLNRIKVNPHTRTIRYDHIRFARIEKFPYAIHYSIDILNNQVLVHSLLSDHRDPDANWHERF